MDVGFYNVPFICKLSAYDVLLKMLNISGVYFRYQRTLDTFIFWFAVNTRFADNIEYIITTAI